MVGKIIKQGPAYYQAIQKSSETAGQGCSFAKDAISFCQRLIECNDTIPNLRRGLQDVKDMARTAHEGSTDMKKRFKDVRAELFKVNWFYAFNILY